MLRHLDRPRPGSGRSARRNEAAARHLWRDTLLPVIADASALDWLPLDPVPRNALRVITPHPGEAARLLTHHRAQVQADRLNALRELSRRFGNCLGGA